jgi:anti-sigma B factor antagonist
MKIKEEKDNNTLVCGIEGDIDINTSVQLRKVFDGFIKNNEKKVLVEFSSVNYVDSSGLATLIEMFQRMKKIGGHLRFSGMSQKVRNAFEITKLHKLFEIFENREAALKDF